MTQHLYPASETSGFFSRETPWESRCRDCVCGVVFDSAHDTLVQYAACCFFFFPSSSVPLWNGRRGRGRMVSFDSDYSGGMALHFFFLRSVFSPLLLFCFFVWTCHWVGFLLRLMRLERTLRFSLICGNLTSQHLACWIGFRVLLLFIVRLLDIGGGCSHRCT